MILSKLSRVVVSMASPQVAPLLFTKTCRPFGHAAFTFAATDSTALWSATSHDNATHFPGPFAFKASAACWSVLQKRQWLQSSPSSSCHSSSWTRFVCLWVVLLPLLFFPWHIIAIAFPFLRVTDPHPQPKPFILTLTLTLTLTLRLKMKTLQPKDQQKS